MNETAFLDAIRAAPRDFPLRLAYADWLEEQGDMRADLIRIEEGMRGLPAFTDRYWCLKPMRNELRQQATPGWLEVMGYGTDCWPLFGHGVPDDWRGRWRLIREFVERWGLLPLGDLGEWEEAIREVEIRLGQTLPPSVREFVAFAYDARPRFSVDGTGESEPFFILGDLYRMEALRGVHALGLMHNCDVDYCWGINFEDLRSEDPPVYRFRPDYDSPDPDPIFLTNDLYYFKLTSLVLKEMFAYPFGGGGVKVRNFADGEDLVRNLETTFTTRGRFEDLNIFESDNLFFMIAPSPEGPGVDTTLHVSKSLPCEAIPAFLWEHARTTYVRYGGMRERYDPQSMPGPADEEIPY